MIGKTNSVVSGGGGGTYETNWNDLTAITLGDISVNPYEITIPPAVTTMADMFRGGTATGGRRTYDLVIHNSGNAITTLYRAFSNSNNYDRHITLDFDTSQVTRWDYLFALGGANTPAKITITGTLDFTSATNVTDIFSGFLYNSSYQSSFRLAEGSLGISWNLGGCNPDDDTLASIIAGLKDMTGGTAQTLTLNTNVKARLTQAQIDAANAKNWSIA